jgi:hypothetical protein
MPYADAARPHAHPPYTDVAGRETREDRPHAQPRRGAPPRPRRPVVCTVALYGPYPSLAAAGRAENALVGAASGATATAVAGTTLALAGPRLTLNDFTSTAQPYALQLPATLALGYYVLDGREVDARGSTGVGIVVEVTPAAP